MKTHLLLAFGLLMSSMASLTYSQNSTLVQINDSLRVTNLSQNDTFSRVWVSNVNGDLHWRSVPSLQDNLGNHQVQQALLPTLNNTFNLGSGVFSFQNLYLGSALYFGNIRYLHLPNSNNIALGLVALNGANAGASGNVAFGNNALELTTTGDYNVGVGDFALNNNTAGSYCTAFGYNARSLANNSNNITAIGNGALTTGSNQVRLGNGSVVSIGGAVNWSIVSDARFKKNVEQNVPGLDFIAKLKPVTYTMDVTRLNSFLGIDGAGKDREASDSEQQAIREKEAIRYTGFIAQEVEQAAREIGYDFSGVDKPQNERDHYGLRYAEFVVPLTKAVQELSALVETQKQENQTLRQELETLKNAVYGATVKTAGSKSSGEETQLIAEGFALYQNTPNPFNKTTVIAAQLPENVQQAKIIVYNLQGLELASYPLQERGKVSVEISGGRFPSGMYLYALVADGQVIDTKKMLLTN